MQTLQLQSEPNKTELQAAFQLFSQMSDQLETSYRDLERQVELLSTELSSANSEKLKQLAEKEKLADRLETLHEAMPAAVIWVDQSQQIQSANQSALDIFKEDIIGEIWPELLNKQSFSFSGHELIATNANVYSYNQRALEAGQGKVIILTDITLSQQLQKSNHHQQRLADLGEMTAGLAHQVRTPLATALLSIDQLSHPSISPELQKKSIKRVKHNLHHLDHLVNDMLLFARDGEFEQDQVGVSSLLEDLSKNIKQKQYQNFSFTVNNVFSDESVSGSRDALLSVLMSLVENASQLATKLSPIELKIESEIKSDQIMISVIDNGPGLTTEQCEQVFKPFYSTKKDGNGLGLAISQSIIRAHNGCLKAVSEKGSGTEMQISLDLYQSDNLLKSNTNKYKKQVV